MFYDVFKSLCDSKGVSCKRASLEIGLSNSISTKWKNTGATPNGETLNKIAEYFGVTTDFLLGQETEKAPTPEGGRPVNIVTIAGRDGSYVERRLTDGQTKALKMFIDELPDADEDYL